jgi:hypothetical protein
MRASQRRNVELRAAIDCSSGVDHAYRASPWPFGWSAGPSARSNRPLPDLRTLPCANLMVGPTLRRDSVLHRHHRPPSSGGLIPRPSSAVQETRRRRVRGRRRNCRAHESARRNWWEDHPSSRNSSEQVRSHYAPPEILARRPCDHRTRLPGPSRGSLLGAVWRFAPAPSGTTKCTRRVDTATTALSTNFVGMARGLSPRFPRVWTECGRPRLQHPCKTRAA